MSFVHNITLKLLLDLHEIKVISVINTCSWVGKMHICLDSADGSLHTSILSNNEYFLESKWIIPVCICLNMFYISCV